MSDRRDIYIERDVQAVGLDPSQAPASVPQHHPSRNHGFRVAIDGYQKARLSGNFSTGERTPRIIAQQWKEYGIED